MVPVKSVWIACIALLLAGLMARALAQTPAEGQAQAQRLQYAVEQMQKTLVDGPREVRLGDLGQLSIPAQAGFVPQPAAGDWASASGYGVDSSRLGMVTPLDEEGGRWVVFISFHGDGHVDDGDASRWSRSDLLAALSRSTLAGNDERRAHNMPELEVRDWLIPPDYDPKSRTLVWAADIREKGDGGDGAGRASINGFVLGRRGYFKMTLTAPNDEIMSHSDKARAILAGLSFRQSERYEDADKQDSKGMDIAALISPGAKASPASLPAWLVTPWPWLGLGIAFLGVAWFGMRRPLRR